MTQTATGRQAVDNSGPPRGMRFPLAANMFCWAGGQAYRRPFASQGTIRVIPLAYYPEFGTHWRRKGDEARLNRGQRSPLMASTPPSCDRTRRRPVEEVTLSTDP